MRLIQNGLNPVTPVVKYHGDIGGNRVKPNCLPNLPRVFRYPCACSSNDRIESSKKKIVWPVKTCYFSRKKKLVMPWKLPAFAMTLVATVPTTSTAIIQWNKKSCQYFFSWRERDKNWWERYYVVWSRLPRVVGFHAAALLTIHILYVNTFLRLCFYKSIRFHFVPKV